MGEESMRERVRKGYEDMDLTGLQPDEKEIPDSEKGMIHSFLSKVPEKGRVLDMGCGTGVPYDRFLAEQGYEVTGVDIAEDNVIEAREHVPEATFLQGGFSSFDPGKTFEGLLCLFALFHVPREEHGSILERFHGFLETGAPMLITVGTSDVEEVSKKFGDVEMVWSFFDADRNRELIKNAGFTIEKTERIPDRVDGSDHLWLLCEA